MIYISKKIPFLEIAEELPSYYGIGTTIEDYDNGLYLLLSSEQAAFHEANPDATPVEVWNMELTPVPEPDPDVPAPEPDELRIAKGIKLQEIEVQDNFSNKFFVSITQGGVEVDNREMWLNKSTRSVLYTYTLPVLEEKGDRSTKLWTTTTPSEDIDVPIVWAFDKLKRLEVYAKETYDLRQRNINMVYAATSVAEVEAIDVKADFPLFLTFELNLDLGV